MQVFDFDNTIYHGESTFDFALYVIMRRKRLLKKIPSLIKIFWKYKKCQMTLPEFYDELNKYHDLFIENRSFILECVNGFWQKNYHKLDAEMLKKIKPGDAIITCSPSFLLDKIKNDLKASTLIATEIDLEKGIINHLNFGQNKVTAFKKKFPKKKITTVYTDSYNDQALMDVAKNVYLVKHGKCQKIK